MEKTPKYKLNKPGGSDYADVEKLNENADLLEAALAGLETGKEALLKNAGAKAAPVDGDSFAIIDSADGNKTKRLTWAGLVAAIKTVLNSVYVLDTRKVNNKPLTSDISLTAADVGAAEKSTQVTATIGTAWGGSAGAWTQTISIAEVTATNVVEVMVAKGATVAQEEAFAALSLKDGGQAAGEIILLARGDKNTATVPITVIVRGDL